MFRLLLVVMSVRLVLVGGSRSDRLDVLDSLPYCTQTSAVTGEINDVSLTGQQTLTVRTTIQMKLALHEAACFKVYSTISRL